MKKLSRDFNDVKEEIGMVDERLPPHSDEVERAVLGCVLNDSATLTTISERVKGDVTVFYDFRHQAVYRAMVEVEDALDPVDLITVQQRLKSRGDLERIGGIAYLTEMQDCVPSVANLPAYLDELMEKALRRRVIAACTEVISKAHNDGLSSDSLVSDVEQVIEMQSSASVIETMTSREAADSLMVELERRYSLEGKLSGLDTGLYDLNRMIEGVQFGEQFVIGARPSQGKTALGLTIFKHVAFSGIPSLFISLEMSAAALMCRLLSMHYEIPLRELRHGSYTEQQFKQFAAFKSEVTKKPLFITNGVSGMTIREVCSTIRRQVVQNGVKLVVIDYLQKIRSAGEKFEKKTYEVGDISSRLKAVAAETKVGMITLAQLNRENTKDKGRPPRLSDLADSGQIERDADTVGLLHRTAEDTMLIIAKQRDGETGIVRIYFDGTHVRFCNLEVNTSNYLPD